MSECLIQHPTGFSNPFTPITEIGENTHDTGMNFGILHLKAGQEKNLTSDCESAYLLMHGQVTFFYDNTHRDAKRSSLFDEDPIAIHCAQNAPVRIKAETDCELACLQTQNPKTFETQVFDHSNMLESEKRGKDLLNDTAYRIVRTIFDDRNRPDANLVLGEVITFPGGWSSYPPHSHPQPEIYHYRFTEPQGFGYGELDDKVYKIKDNATLKILDNQTHAQVAAPGYGMYYIWMIRHLPNNRYDVPTFVEAHDWTRSKEANTRVWQPNKG